MKRTITTAILLVMTAGGFIDAQQSNSDATMVYICTGTSSKRYHKTDECRGLNNCNDDIQLVTLEKAKQLGRTACKICFRR